ncbi:MAG TPA: ThiF family adenylyltransferase [Tepidisphaeraceae bacterium]|nr:ThiF family adenylyltransferase [Tepidisphaeraceae bacterium]
MPGPFHHESLYRGKDLLAKLASLRIVICGVGAVGSNLADNLARHGVVNLRAIDDDRVESHNVSTQLYGETDVGAWKVEALRNHLFRTCGIEIDGVRKKIAVGRARPLLKECGLIIDALDNSASRQIVQEYARSANAMCMHVGLFEDYCEVVWDERYQVPKDAAVGDVCDYALAHNLVMLAVTIASESVLRWMESGQCISMTGTLRDLAVREMER